MLKLTESTKKILEEEFNQDFDNLSEEEIVQKAKSSKKVTVSIKENGKTVIRQVLHG